MGAGASSDVKPMNSVREPNQNDLLCTPTKPKSTPLAKMSASEQQSQTPVHVLDRPPRPTSSKQRGSCTYSSPHSVGESVGESNLTDHKRQLEESKEYAATLEGRVKDLEKQLGELDSQNLDLAEQLQATEERLEEQHKKTLVNAPSHCTNTVAAKDQHIKKLEHETKVVQEEIRKLKTKHKKKLRQLHSQLAEAKHECSLKGFELKDEISNLKEENYSLIEKLRSVNLNPVMESSTDGPGNSLLENDDSTLPANDHTALVLALSGRVSEQESKILELETKLREKDKTIGQLKIQTQSGSAKNQRTGNVDYHSSTAVSAELPDDCVVANKSAARGQWLVDQRAVDPVQPTSTWAAQPGHTELSEMKSIVKEMKQLHKKKKNNKALRSRRAVQERFAGNSRESSGTSRDSGVASVEVDPSVHTSKANDSRVDSATSKTSGLSEEDNFDLDSVTTMVTASRLLQKSDRKNSAKSQISEWSDDSEPEKDVDRCSNISISNIRRISAPKKKKKHVLSEHDLLVDSLMKDLTDLSMPSKPPSGSRDHTVNVASQPIAMKQY